MAIAKELRKLSSEPLDGIKVQLNEEDVTDVIADICGPGACSRVTWQRHGAIRVAQVTLVELGARRMHLDASAAGGHLRAGRRRCCSGHFPHSTAHRPPCFLRLRAQTAHHSRAAPTRSSLSCRATTPSRRPKARRSARPLTQPRRSCPNLQQRLPRPAPSSLLARASARRLSRARPPRAQGSSRPGFSTRTSPSRARSASTR